MRAVTPFAWKLAALAVIALILLVAGSAAAQIAGGGLLLVAAASAVGGANSSGQGLGRLYDPERLRREPSDARAIGEAVARGLADPSTQAAAYTEVMHRSTHP